jgi:TorA maturation chaperone TorD
LGLEGPAEEFLAASEGADLEELQATYNRLFGVPDDDGEYRVAPYEAQYTAGSEISHQQRRIATVVGLMEAFGVEPSETFTERQDHVAAELELMQVVAAKRALAYREGDPDAARDLRDAEATILAEHLVEFVPALAHDLQQATDDPVYRSAATFTQQLVEWDHASHPDAETVPTDPEGGEVTTDAR